MWMSAELWIAGCILTCWQSWDIHEPRKKKWWKHWVLSSQESSQHCGKVTKKAMSSDQSVVGWKTMLSNHHLTFRTGGKLSALIYLSLCNPGARWVSYYSSTSYCQAAVSIKILFWFWTDLWPAPKFPRYTHQLPVAENGPQVHVSTSSWIDFLTPCSAGSSHQFLDPMGQQGCSPYAPAQIYPLPSSRMPHTMKCSHNLYNRGCNHQRLHCK